MNADQVEAGLPDFAEAVFIAVGVAADGLRYPLAFLECGQESGDLEQRRCFVAEASAKSAREWHVHLLLSDAGRRRSMVMDLDGIGCAASIGAAPDFAPQNSSALQDCETAAAA